MARPIKQGLDYFPVDTDMDADDKIVLIEGRYGIEGYGAVVKLYAKIYKEGYYYKWTEKEMLLFSQRTRLKEPFIKDVVDDCLKWGIFNEKIFKKYEILTSNGIQKRYFEAVKRRLKINVCKEYVINGVLDNINDVNVCFYSINDNISTQRKVKEIESKVEKRKHGDNVFLLDVEYKKLIEKYGEEIVKDKIEDLDIGIGSKGYKYKSHYMTLIGWIKKDLKEKNKKLIQIGD